MEVSSSDNDKPKNAHTLSEEAEGSESSEESSEKEHVKPATASSGGEEASSSDNDKPAQSTPSPKKVAGGRAALEVAGKRDEPDSSGDSEAPHRGVSKHARGGKKKRVGKKAGNSSDSSEAQGVEAGMEESGTKMELTNMELRRGPPKNYTEEDPSQVKDDQQILMTALENLKIYIYIYI